MNSSVDTDLNVDAAIVAIQNLVQQAINDHVLPGAVALVTHRGSTVFQQAFGVADIKTGRAHSIDDLFYLGSTSKPLAATSILALVDAGKLDLDKPASFWIPELNHCKLKLGRVSRPPTIKELLSHTAGLFGNASATPRQQRLVWNFGSSLAATATQIAKQPYIYEPGNGFSYGGASMTIASRIAELITGLEFDEVANTAVFKKLGMKNTFYRTSSEFSNRFSVLYKKSGRTLHKARFQPHATPDSFVLPAGGIISTAHDLSAFLQLFLNNNEHENQKILAPKLKLEMRTDATNGQPMDFKTTNRQQNTADITENKGYGLGWMLDEIDDNHYANVFFHGGAFGTLIWGDTRASLGIILLTHTPFAQVAQLWDDVIKIIRKSWGRTGM